MRPTYPYESTREGGASIWKRFVGSDGNYIGNRSYSGDCADYVLQYSYTKFSSFDAAKKAFEADYADWLKEVKKRDEEMKKINSSGETSENKATLKDKLGTEPLDLNQGEFNKLFEKIKQIETDFKKSIPEKVRDAKEIMAEIEKKNREIVEKMDEKLDKLQDNKNNLGQQFKNAFDQNNKSQMAVIKAKMKEVDDKMTEIIENKASIPNEDWVKNYLQESQEERNKFFFEKIDWKSPRIYIAIGIVLTVTFALIYFIYWIIKKFLYG